MLRQEAMKLAGTWTHVPAAPALLLLHGVILKDVRRRASWKLWYLLFLIRMKKEKMK